MASVDNRAHVVHSPLPPNDQGEDPLIFFKMEAKEHLSQPFEYKVDLLSLQFDVDPNDLLGENLTVCVHIHERVRHFNGVVTQWSHLGRYGGYAAYRVVLRPWFWCLTRTANCRIFQELSVVDIFQEVAKETHGFGDFRMSLSQSYDPRVYCVQYRESDFQFLSRILEEEGIFYFFEHEDGKHTLVLGDSKSAFGNVDGETDIPYRAPGEANVETEHISQWQVRHDMQTSTVILDDYDFTKPKVDLEGRSMVSRQHSQADYELFDYPGRYSEVRDGERLAKIRIEELQVGHKQLVGESDHRGLEAGRLFNLVEYPRDGENGEYLVVSSKIEVESAEVEQMRTSAENRFQIAFVALTSDTPYRPTRLTRKPIVQGPQTAVVVGKDGEEIWTDKYARVKVQFHWDREGESNENSSCWIRVSQLWAGKNWGGIQIPRIGQEVVVDFLEGDPDRPLITGRVYNDDVMPPYSLPANQTQSGVISRSTKDGTPETFNELRFEDKKDEEEVYFHAERDFQRIVENNDVTKVGFEKKESGDQTVEVFNNQVIKVGTSSANDGSQTTEVWKNRSAEIKTGDDTTKISAGAGTVEAAKSITLKVGASSIKIEPAKITIKAPQIVVQADARIEATAPMNNVKGSAMLMLEGGLVKIN